MFLDDPALVDAVRGRIREEALSAEWVLADVVNSLAALLEGMEDEYFRPGVQMYVMSAGGYCACCWGLARPISAASANLRSSSHKT